MDRIGVRKHLEDDRLKELRKGDDGMLHRLNLRSAPSSFEGFYITGNSESGVGFLVRWVISFINPLMLTMPSAQLWA